MKQPSDFVLITGVSTGIGNALMHSLIKRGYKVIGTVRSEKDKAKIKAEMGVNGYAILMDVTDEEGVKASVKEVESILAGKGLAGLINNAGIAIGGPLSEMPMKQIRFHFDVNVFGLLNVTRAYLPLLGAREGHSNLPGKIVNVSSLSGELAGPFVGAYTGSKFAVEGISQTLRRELLLYGIDVIVAGPGNVITPIWDKGVKPEPYKNSAYYPYIEKFVAFVLKDYRTGYTAEKMGELIANAFTANKPKARYAFVKNGFTKRVLPKLIPTRILDKIIGKQLGFIK